MYRIIDRYPLPGETEQREMEIDEWVTERRKGCKRYRNIMTGRWSREYQEHSPMGIAAGITLWGNNIGIWENE